MKNIVVIAGSFGFSCATKQSQLLKEEIASPRGISLVGLAMTNMSVAI